MWRPITFSLVVDDFGIKLQGIQHVRHIKKTLEEHYEVSVDWKGRLFFGIALDWNYAMGFVDLSVPGYVQKARVKYQHPIPKCPQHYPYQAAPIKYDAKIRHPVPENTSPPLIEEKIRRVQDVVGTFVWYGALCDPTLAASLSALATRQSKGTDNVKKASHQLLDCLATHPNAAIRYHASNMILALDTDASYLSDPNARSRAAAYYFLTRKDRPNFNNRVIDILSTVIKHVMSSALEAKTGALYYGCK